MTGSAFGAYEIVRILDAVAPEESVTVSVMVAVPVPLAGAVHLGDVPVPVIIPTDGVHP